MTLCVSGQIRISESPQLFWGVSYSSARLLTMTFPIVNGMRTVEFGNPGESRNKLISLILDGNKRATAGTLEWDYVAENEPIESVGEKLAVLDNENRHIATIQATRVEVKRFADVPTEFALALSLIHI